MLTTADLKALAAYLRTEADTNAHCARQAAVLGHPKTVTIHEAEAEQFNHWAAGIEDLAQTRALTALDLPPPPVAIEGLTDGPCFCFGGACAACREREDGRPAATFFPHF